MNEEPRWRVRPIAEGDSPGIARVIRTVMPEFGASGPGFAIHDPEVGDMFTAYAKGERSAYWVVADREGVVAGGGGIAPLSGGDGKTCELRKMYFLPELRGLGLGRELMDLCLAKARELGFERCYLETLKDMAQARALYQKNGFTAIGKPMGATGHFGCDAWYLREL